MKSNTSVRDMLNKLTKEEVDNDINTRLQNLGSVVTNHVSFSLSKEEKIAIFQDVKMMIQDQISLDLIAGSVINLIEEILKEKESMVSGKTGPKLKGFRRVEE
ncbi:MAG: hypothetical protein WC942_01145 [Clostridia bacterium]|jgi:hypothetical protein